METTNWKPYLDGEYLAYAVSSIWSEYAMPILQFNIKEYLYEPYEIEAQIVLAGPLDVKMLGQMICIGIGGQSAALRTFTGALGKFQYENVVGLKNNPQYVYRIWLYPTLWKLKFDSQLRIFEQQENRQIITNILKQANIDVQSSLINTNNVNETNTQFNENTLDYLIRLMQEAGVIGYFDCSLLIADNPETGVKYSNVLPQYVLAENIQTVSSFSLAFKELQIGFNDFSSILTFSLLNSSIGNIISLFDYNFQTAETQTTASLQTQSWIKSVAEIYPTDTINSAQASVAAENLQKTWNTNQIKFEATTTSYLAQAGSIMTLTNCSEDSVNGDYFVEYVEHSLNLINDTWEYQNKIQGVLKTNTYAPTQTKQKPKMYGNQTAVVMGTSDNTQVNVDQFGRIQVRFMWVHGDSAEDISNNITNETSAWARVMQWGAAGSSWGNVSLPRVGQEVVVGFINGDIDYPIILGSVYNSANSFPKSMPDNAPTFVVKTNTMGEAGKLGLRYNEIRIEDTELDELFYIRAQNNAQFEILNDFIKNISGNEIEEIEGDVMRNITQGSRYERIGASNVMPGDVTIGTTIAADALGDAIDMLTIKKGIKIIHIDTGAFALIVDSGDITISVPKGTYNKLVDIYSVITRGMSTTVVGGANILRVSGDNTLSVKGDYNISVDGLCSKSISGIYSTSVTGEYKMSAQGAMSLTGDAVSVSALADMSIEAAGILSLKGATINLEAAEISITGGMISATSDAVFEISAGAMVTIKGAMIQIN